MDEREMFEAWLKQPHQNNWNDSNHPLEVGELQAAWLAWQAARRTTPDREAWQPIETAPNEGQFLVYMPEETRQPIQVARWHPNVKVIGNAFAFDLPNPTHWTPLPTAPGQTPVASPRDTLIEEIAEMVDHMGEGRRLEEYVGAIREIKSSDKGGA